MAENEHQQKEDHGKRYATWTFTEYQEHARSKWWYIISSVIMLGLLTYSILSKNYLFTVILAAATFIYILQLQRKPRLVTISVTEDGIEIHEAFYPYKDFKKFWIIYEPPEVKTLYIEFKGGYRPMLSVPLEKQNPLVIRDILLTYVEEDLERDEELFSDALQRKLKL